MPLIVYCPTSYGMDWGALGRFMVGPPGEIRALQAAGMHWGRRVLRGRLASHERLGVKIVAEPVPGVLSMSTHPHKDHASLRPSRCYYRVLAWPQECQEHATRSSGA